MPLNSAKNQMLRTKAAVSVWEYKTVKALALFLLLSAPASAVVITLGTSNQAVTFTGTGTNQNGAGTSRVSWGACTYDGTTTTCTVSGSYTGLGNGGTYMFVLAYPGNGLSPLSAVAFPIGSNTIFFNLTAGSFTTSITRTGGSPITFYDPTFTFDFNSFASCAGVAVCAVGPVGTTPGSSITGPIQGAFDLTPVITSSASIITAASYGGFNAIAPATWIEIYGTNLATTLFQVWGGDDFKGAQAPTALGGTTVTIAGKPAYVDFVSPHQVNAQVPSGIPTGIQKVVVTTVGGPSFGTSVTVNPVQPAILAPPVFKFGAGQYAVALFPDNTTYVLPPGVTSAVKTARAKPGDTITLYGVGFGPVTPNIDAGIVVGQANNLPEFKAFFAGVPATVQFAGLVADSVGLYQFNVVVPKVPANDATPFTFSIGSNTGTQTLLLPIGN